MATATHQTDELSRPAFENEAADVLARLRQAFSTVIDAAQVSIDKAADVKRAFDLDTKVAWQVYRVARATNPLQAGVHVPGPSTMRKLLKYMVKRGMHERAIAEFKEASAAFDQLVRDHAGDRTVFDSMIANWVGEGDANVDLARRRDAYRGNSHIHGIAAKALLACNIHQASDKPEHFDLVMLRGYFDLVRLRPGTSCILTKFSARETEHTEPITGRYPLDAEAETRYGGPVLPKYSTPLPNELELIEKQPGIYINRLVGRRIGRQEARTYVFGEIIRGLHIPRDSEIALDPCMGIRLPVQTAITDYLIPASLFGRLIPKSTIWGDTSGEAGLGEDPWKAREFANQLPMPNLSAYIGTGPSVLHTEFCPRYREMVQWACATLGWDIMAFDVYRTCIQFPVLNSFVITEFRKT